MRRALVGNAPRRGAWQMVGLVLKAGAVAIFLTAILAFPAVAQQLGLRTLELNAFGRYTDFAPAIGLQSGVGGGFRLGYFVLPRWQLEGGMGLARVDRMSGTETLNVIPILLDVTYNLPVGVHELLLGGGAVYNKYGPSHAWGTSVTAGVRLAFGSTAALRVDGTREYMNKRDDVARHSNWGFRLGLSWMLAQRALIRDSIPINRGEAAMVDRPRMPLLRVSDPVAIMRLENTRALRDAVSHQDSVRVDRTQGLAVARVAGLRAVEVRDRMSIAIHFDVGRSEIRPDAVAALEAKLDLLRGIPALRIRIEGQADIRGSNADNITLAWTRAEAAKLWLTNRGIASDRIDAVGFSALRPHCDDPYESCWWQNRRAEFVIVAGADAVVQDRP